MRPRSDSDKGKVSEREKVNFPITPRPSRGSVSSGSGADRSRSPSPFPESAETMMPFYVLQGPEYKSTLPKGDPDDPKIASATNVFFEPNSIKFSVRGPDYLTNKVKIRSAPSLLRYVAADLLSIPGEKLSDACSYPGSVPSLYPDRKFIVLNWQLPASPQFSFVAYYVYPTEEELNEYDKDLPDDIRAARKVAFALLDKFASDEVNDEWRNGRFKLIPQIVEGPWLVKKVTPSNVPALIGNKLTTHYFKGPNYLEIDVDITSSTAANSIWTVIHKTLASLVIDLAFLIQGNEQSELPEALFGTVRISRVSLTPEFVREVKKA